MATAKETAENIINKTSEEVIYNLYDYCRKMDYHTCQNLVKEWSQMTRENFTIVLAAKQIIYSRRWDNALLKNLVANIRADYPIYYDTYCLCVAITLCKYANTDLSAIKIPHRKNPNPIPKNLEYKIKVNYAEITMLRQQYSWQDVAKIIKKNHRHQFEGYKLTASYLRRVYNKIAQK